MGLYLICRNIKKSHPNENKQKSPLMSMCVYMIRAHENNFYFVNIIRGRKVTENKEKNHFLNLASVQTIRFSKWSTVSPLGQAPVFMSL